MRTCANSEDQLHHSEQPIYFKLNQSIRNPKLLMVTEKNTAQQHAQAPFVVTGFSYVQPLMTDLNILVTNLLLSE